MRARRVAVLCWALLTAGGAHAQPPPDEPGDEGSPEQQQPVLTPPRVVSLPPVELPADAPVPEDGAVALELTIDADGVATVDSCDAAESVCDPIREAIAAGEIEPATRDGEPIPARIRMRFRVSRAQPEQQTGQAGEGGGEQTGETAGGGTGPEGNEVVEDEQGFGATGTVERLPEGALRLELEEMRELPGAFGDPFRAIEALPGVTPILSGLPYFYIRGAPPSGTLYVYDDITLPALYHLGLGPSVVHPRMVGPLRLYTGVPPARFGRFIGGVIEAEGPGQPEDAALHGEAELRLLDVTGFVQTPVGDGNLAVAARYGYPGLLLSIFSPEVSLAYWDYQLRFEHPIASHDSVEIVWLGSYDAFSSQNEVAGPTDGSTTEESSLTIQFHRLEARLVRRLPGFELGTALRLGWEQSALDEEVSIEAFTAGPRMWALLHEDSWRLRLGADMFGAAGDMTFAPSDGPTEDAPTDPSRNQTYASVAARNVASLYAELSWDPAAALTLDLGLRADAWATGSSIEAALDPRLRVTWHAEDWLDVHVAGGVARQPAVFFIPLPGLTEVAIDRGLQTALQAEAGVSTEPVEDLKIEAQGFVHRYWDLLFPDLYAGGEVCDVGGCRSVEQNPRANGLSYGGELFIRRDPSHRLSGFLSYTLAWAELDALESLDYTPSYDVRHVVNLAGRWRIGGGFSVGLRLHFRSGKPLGNYYFDREELAVKRYEQRLPGFFRADAQIAYQWRTGWGRFRLALEWLNLTFSREPVDLQCPSGLDGPPSEPCPVEYVPAIVVPNLGLRATF